MDLDRLRAQLLASGIQQSNNALFQVIEQLIKELRKTTNTAVAASSSGSIASSLTLLTSTNQAASLPNSRQLIAGANITFDDTVVNERTISTASGAVEWSVLTDGDLIEPELIYAGGEVIMTHVP